MQCHANFWKAVQSSLQNSHCYKNNWGHVVVKGGYLPTVTDVILLNGIVSFQILRAPTVCIELHSSCRSLSCSCLDA